MKDSWIVTSIGEICNVKTGKLDANASCANGKYPFFTCSKETLHINTYSYDLECLLIAGNGDLNVKYYKGKFDAYQRTYIVSLKNNTLKISTYYLYMFFSKYIEVLRNRSIGGVIKYIKLGDITNAKVPIPSFEEQSRIVEELDQLSNIIEKKRQQLSELDNLAQSIFYDMFGDPNSNNKKWERIKFGSICRNLDYQRKPITAKDRLKGNIPYYGASGIVDYVKDYIFDGDFLLISEDGANLSVRHTPIAFKITGKTWVNNHAHVVRFNDIISMLFVEYYINLLDISDLITGCAQPKLTQANLNNILIFDVPLPLQKLFAQKIEAIEKEKELIKQSIAETEELFNSRMDYYFG